MPIINIFIIYFIALPKKIASYFEWAGPLIARITVGYVFMLTGWGKLNNLPQITEYFASLGIPFPEILTPFVAGLECFGGLFLMIGFLTRISGGGLAITMIVAILSAKWGDVDSVETLLGFEEATYLAVFTWFAICGAGKASIDYFLEKKLN
jgi:putative oxidoreductase